MNCVDLRVLIVDDNRDAADSLADLVRLWGHVPSVAYDGAAGLCAAVANRPDCLILDINMPGINGYELARTVRRQSGLAGAKLIAVSARSDSEHVHRAQEVGFDYCLTKPADPAELEGMLAMIGRIMQLSARTEELARRNLEVAERAEAVVKNSEVIAQKTEAMVSETRELLKEVKEELQEVKQEVRDIKNEIRDVKDNGTSE